MWRCCENIYLSSLCIHLSHCRIVWRSGREVCSRIQRWTQESRAASNLGWVSLSNIQHWVRPPSWLSAPPTPLVGRWASPITLTYRHYSLKTSSLFPPPIPNKCCSAGYKCFISVLWSILCLILLFIPYSRLTISTYFLNIWKWENPPPAMFHHHRVVIVTNVLPLQVVEKEEDGVKQRPATTVKSLSQWLVFVRTHIRSMHACTYWRAHTYAHTEQQ